MMKLTFSLMLFVSQIFYFSSQGISASYDDGDETTCCYYSENIASLAGFGPDAYDCPCFGETRDSYERKVDRRKQKAKMFCCCGLPLALSGAAVSYFTCGEIDPYSYSPDFFSEPKFRDLCIEEEKAHYAPIEKRLDQAGSHLGAGAIRDNYEHVEHLCSERPMTPEQIVEALALSSVEQGGRHGAQGLMVLGGCGVFLGAAHAGGYVYGLCAIGAKKIARKLGTCLPTHMKEE